ncbi:uncharacterized protein LOC109817820 [Cajanus cajan]|uniref:uncharacterized protein LOC109817820 n=1 Tax=Cajanus cajan TaxID=3821 RepID=UPI00098D9DDC|nr:uncharacterized protein LOC109817820 [Cajanus cajan]
MVIAVEVANWEVHNTLIDQGSSADVLYWPTFLRLDIPHSLIQPHIEPLVGFAGERVHTRGYVDLLRTFGTSPDTRRIMVRYLLVEANTSYNIIIGKPTLNQLGAVVSTPHLTTKFPGSEGKTISVKANQKTARQCYAESLKVSPPDERCRSDPPTVAHITHADITDLDPSADMSGIDADFIYHRLAIHKEAKPVAQKKRKVGDRTHLSALRALEFSMNLCFFSSVHCALGFSLPA